MAVPPDILWTDVVALAPELANPKVAVPAQTYFLGFANQRLTEAHFPAEPDGSWSTLTLVRAYFVAHLSTMGLYGVRGPVTNESLGAASKGYANLFSSNNFLFATTGYGRMFSVLVRTSACVLGFTTGPDIGGPGCL